LNQIVRNTEAARAAEAAGQLIFLPTGDGMALVFTGSVEEPVECALQISQKLCAQPSLPVRMGIHSGPVHHVADVNQRENIAGAAETWQAASSTRAGIGTGKTFTTLNSAFNRRFDAL